MYISFMLLLSVLLYLVLLQALLSASDRVSLDILSVTAYHWQPISGSLSVAAWSFEQVAELMDLHPTNNHCIIIITG